MSRTITSAVVTGGGSGLGRSLALELARRGAKVVVSDVNEVGASETVALITDAGGTALAHPADVADAEAMAALADAAEAAHGPLDGWVNNAGVAVAGPIGESPLDDWRWIVDINLMGVVHGCHVAAPRFRAQGKGVVLNVASAAGLVSTPMMGSYNATKAAVVALTETLYQELREDGATATVLCPTFFQTNLLDTARSTRASQMKVASKLMARSSFTADDVARAGLDDALAGRLYSVPMADGRWMWRLRRLAPQAFYDLFQWGANALEKRNRKG